jgi:hypothetical protein
MKTKYINIALSAIVIVTILLSSGCSSDEGGDPSPLDVQLALLENENKSWISAGGSITKDGFDVSDQFAGFKLTITGFNYKTENSLSGVWAIQGSWSFKNDQITAMERNDGVVVTIDNISSTQLVLSFTDPNGTGGRYSSISGDYVLTLVSE